MSGIGHLAAGLALKPLDEKLPLWALLAASEANEIIYFIFSSAGIEDKATFTIDLAHGVTYLSTATNPWSHGLFMSVVWSLLGAGLALLFTRRVRAAVLIGLAVFSHWVLDFLMHANLPLFFGGSPLLGLGLENSGPGIIFMTVLDLSLLGGSLAYYLKDRRSRSVPQTHLLKDRPLYE